MTPVAAWAPEVNLTPMLRAAAGLGADVVRAEQDALVEAARTQLDAFKKAQREGRRRQLATAFVNRVAQRLAAAPRRGAPARHAPIAVRQRTGERRRRLHRGGPADGAKDLAGRRPDRDRRRIRWRVPAPGP